MANEPGPPEFSFTKHEARAKEELATINKNWKRAKYQTVVLTHPDGRSVTVNADPSDEAYLDFTHKGFACKDEEKHLVKLPKTESQEKQELLDRLAVLEAKLEAQSKAAFAAAPLPIPAAKTETDAKTVKPTK